MSVKLWIFDWNGTCQNDFDFGYNANVFIFEHYKIPPPSPEIFRAELTTNYIEFYKNHGLPNATAEELNFIRRNYFQNHSSKPELNPGLIGILNELLWRGDYTALVSGENSELLQKQLSCHKIEKLFDFVRGDASPGKKEELIITLDFFRIKAEDGVYIDDMVDGLETAKRLGIKTIAFVYPKSYNSEKRLRAVNVDYEINHLLDISRLLEETNL